MDDCDDPACYCKEEILRPELTRFVLFPIRYPKIWSAYKTAQASFWTTAEIDLSHDAMQWREALNDGERQLLSTILAFFAASDGIVVENLVTRFCSEVQIAEARCFYGYQIMMENIHSEMYALLIQELVSDASEQERLFTALSTMPTVKAKAEWCMRWITSPTSDFGTRLTAFAIMEGVFFSSSFAAIFWFRSRGLLPGLCTSNELIARDEGMHTGFACLLLQYLGRTPSWDVVRAMMTEAVTLEKDFFRAALPYALNGMNESLMGNYVEYVGDFLLGQLGFAGHFGKDNPFPFMETTVAGGRANFFERGVTEYIGAVV
ncbi:putative ribonucleoside-diphosphate reductase small chain B [Lentinus tigrinus ALCF2SS1-7]|uniref:Putative ribonucleoside-diphosphate reductase small chain B n=1 Tax=Lentinus tigrinus ALCF2SS1-6 TaxID=1328759 RepID=A0A5C2SMN2_9APHY|nr:putative ribonucleoside-diphosphate reductase small chain B [Lentinus tigrinus ALCF2SS1-6]RPD76617.1 putative ribonucleoside-diphosphate reductase small chain B [Lentinus tigrinus ALCF2SS1-7]